jgi:hypothetical protein
VPRKRHHGDLHERKERQRREDRVQLVMVCHVEYRDVGVLPGDAPQMPPLAAALQLLGAGFLFGLQPFEFGGINATRSRKLLDKIKLQPRGTGSRNQRGYLDRFGNSPDAWNSRQGCLYGAGGLLTPSS